MIIKNAQIYTPAHRFAPGELAVRDGRITADAAPLPGEEVIDAGGLYALPAWPTLRPARASWPSAPPP